MNVTEKISRQRLVAASFALLSILAGFLLPLVNATPVAATSLVLTPATGPVGAAVTADMAGISGQWLLNWDDALSTMLIGGNTTNANIARQFQVPPTPGGTHTVYLSSEGGNSSALFVVTPSIFLTPTTGKAGSSIAVNGSGFGASEANISITLAGISVQQGITADANGSWSTTFVMPASPGGALDVVAAGPTTVASANTTRQVTVAPGLTIASLTGPVGTTVAVTGSSFRASETGVVVVFDGNINLASPTVSATGGFVINIIIPDTTAGNHNITARGSITQSSEVGDTIFQVTSGLSVEPKNAISGTSITIKGSGFAANETGIVVSFDGKQIASGITASSTGSWSTTYVIPVMPGGAKNINAFGSVTSTAAVPALPFTITARATATVTQGKVGTDVSMEGFSFGANENVTILVDNQPVASAGGFSSDASGGWKKTFKFPEAATGAHQITASGASTPPTAPLPFTIQPDATLSPDNGNVGTVIKSEGTGFGASKPLTVKYDANSVAGAFSTGGTGSFSISFPAPASIGGDHKITVSDGTTTREFNWAMEKTAPPVPKLVKPEDNVYPNGFDGLFGDISVTFQWGKVEDPSGVKYVFQLAKDETFSTDKLVASFTTDNLTYRSSLLPLTDFPMNNYYWRVKAVDGASNESAWTKPQSFHSGVMPIWGFAVAGVLILGLCAWGILWALRRPPGEPRYKPEKEPRYKPEKEPRYKPEREPKAPRASRKPSRDEEEKEYPPVDEDEPSAVGPPEDDDIDSFVAGKVAGLTDNDIPALAKKKEMSSRGLTAAAIYKAIARLEMNGTISRSDEGRYLSGMLGAKRAPEPEFEEEPAPPAPKGKAPPSKPIRREPEPEPEAAPVVSPQDIDATLLRALDGVTESDLPQVAQRPDIQDLGLNLSKLYRQVDRLKAEGKLPLDSRGRFATGSKKKDQGEDLLPTLEELPDRPKVRGAAPAPSKSAPPPAEPADEPGQLMLRTVGGLDADGVTDLPMRPEFQKLGLNLARVYKTIARLEQEGKVSKDHRGRYQVKGAVPTAYEAPPEPTFEPEAPAPPSRDPDEELVLKAIIGITDADVTQLAQSPDMKARGLNLSRLYKIVSRLDKDGKVTRDNRGRFQLPGGAAASAPETMEAPSEIPEKAQRPAFKPTEVTAGLDLRDPYEDTVFNAVIGQSDADVTQLVNSDTMKLRGLTLARIYKITARLEKDGKLVRDEKGRYQKSVSRGPSTSATAFDTPARPAASSPEDVMRPAIEFDATAVEGLVADVMEGLSATDIPTVAKNEALKARGVTLARLFSLCAKLEREGKLIRDEKGKYRKPGGGEAKAV